VVEKLLLKEITILAFATAAAAADTELQFGKTEQKGGE